MAIFNGTLAAPEAEGTSREASVEKVQQRCCCCEEVSKELKMDSVRQKAVEEFVRKFGVSLMSAICEKDKAQILRQLSGNTLLKSVGIPKEELVQGNSEAAEKLEVLAGAECSGAPETEKAVQALDVSTSGNTTKHDFKNPFMKDFVARPATNCVARCILARDTPGGPTTGGGVTVPDPPAF